MTLTVVRELVTTITSLVLSFTSPNADFLDYRYREPINGRTAYTYVKDTTGLNTPDEIDKFFDDFIKYDSLNDSHDGHPGSDYMQNPLETYLVGKGDCDDYANIACKFLRKNGYKAQVMSIGCNGVGHAVCVYIEDGFKVISNDRPDKTFRSLIEIAEFYRKDWNKFQFLEEDILSSNGSDIVFEMKKDGTKAGKTEFPLVIK